MEALPRSGGWSLGTEGAPGTMAAVSPTVAVRTRNSGMSIFGARVDDDANSAGDVDDDVSGQIRRELDGNRRVSAGIDVCKDSGEVEGPEEIEEGVSADWNFGSGSDGPGSTNLQKVGRAGLECCELGKYGIETAKQRPFLVRTWISNCVRFSPI
jgi:hypothetical protein